jgi:hypothetical protein
VKAGIVTAQAVALVLLLVAWYGASGEVRITDQWVWGVVSLAALSLSAVANAVAIVGFRRGLARGAERF